MVNGWRIAFESSGRRSGVERRSEILRNMGLATSSSLQFREFLASTRTSGLTRHDFRCSALPRILGERNSMEARYDREETESFVGSLAPKPLLALTLGKPLLALNRLFIPS